MFGNMHSWILWAVCVFLFMSQWDVCEFKRQRGRGHKEKLPRKLDINENVVRMWADKFSRTITEEVKKFTAYNAIRKKYQKLTSTHRWSPEILIKRTALSIKRLLQSKVRAVRNLVAVAEEASRNHTFDEQLQFDYLNNKKLLTDADLLMMGINRTNPDVVRPPPRTHNVTKSTGGGQEANFHSDVMLVGVGTTTMAKYRYLPTVNSPRFNNAAVNFNTSTIHVPTNVYDKNALIQNGVKWSEALNERMLQNDREIKGLTWQYFCSSDGFFRIFPGIRWPQDNKGGNIDMFDCRVRNWYIESSSSPKNVIILVDTSGSMKGLRMEITRSTIERILETFSSKDYFNIISFNKNVTYLDPCFNGTMMQANKENRERLAGYIKNLKTSYIARFDKALTEAFNLFEREEAAWGSPLCNKAIMLITDGAPEGYEKIFEERNWQSENRKPVRMFTFLIGREVSDNRNAKWMACANKGYYSHISTLADVSENVQHYLKVLSRPMVIQRKRNAIWTPLYADYSTEVSPDLSDGLKFLTSYALPVFDMKDKSKTEGNLLGVVGTDVPVDQIKARIPYNKLGPNGYAFVVTSQGYVLFHPNLRPFYFKRLSREPGLKANFSSVDITEVEYVSNNAELQMLRLEILKASGYANYSIKNVVVPYDGRKRVSVVDFTYHIYPIGETGFKLVFAVPTDYGTTLVNTKVSYGSNQLSYFMDNNTRFAPWRFCRNDDILLAKGDERKRSLYNLFYIEGGRCENNKMAKFDVISLHDVVELWKSVSTYENTKRHGIALIFLGTKSGITRFLNTDLLPSSLEFINLNERTVDSMYYKRAVEGRVQDGYNFTFSMPVGEAYTGDENNVVTISVPLELNIAQVGPAKDLFPMVLGLQMKYQQIQTIIADIIQKCWNISDCDITCSSIRVNCYLMDNNGYVIMSKERAEVGGFFGDANGAMMREMLDRRLFQEINFMDYQGMCESNDSGEDESSANRLINPFKTILSVILWTFGEIALFLSQWSFQSWFHSFHRSEASPTSTDCQTLEYNVADMTPDLKDLFYYHYKKMAQCQPSFVINPCHKNMTLYKADFRRLRIPRIKGTIYGCDQCNISYVVQWIRDTNLIFVISSAGCDCTGRPGFEQPNYGPVAVPQTETHFCSRLENQSSQRRQSFGRKNFKCIDADDDTEDDTRCGQCQIRVSLLLTILCLISTWTVHTKIRSDS
ncbi:voltage-dependent calcium channel subunit alpha-2/delta-3-like isoform X2 [Pecten maximus]|uniref:voltage-dependent calcium channel subunit alpha-2/delta-3-like isoform X2 n=1 Tax=Pecten maximus TaxID=6579 RepID=UPI0014587DC8|nr:voltage-dependent calcium channel subunit alpha-2/delta-3-like isoform X2 [Pecten maximus]